jgi:S1-C subfamily serine protease
MQELYAGTGFFIDRHILVTCAHVVHGSPGRVTVVWENRKFEADVVAVVPAEPGDGDHYAFPDLAFLAVEDAPDHPDLRPHESFLKVPGDASDPM